MADLDQQVATLKRRIAEAVKARASAEHQQAVARDHRDEAAKALLEEFGILPEEVPAFAVRLEDDLAAEAKRVEEWLDKAEEKA